VMMASSLDGSKLTHKAVAWALLLVIVGLPVLIRLADWLGA
jgi:hypothetical protein